MKMMDDVALFVQAEKDIDIQQSYATVEESYWNS